MPLITGLTFCLVEGNIDTYKKREDLVGFYDISTIAGYLMPNPFFTYIYISNTMICILILWILFLKRA